MGEYKKFKRKQKNGLTKTKMFGRNEKKYYFIPGIKYILRN
jgi:hypothetical protein